MSDLEELDDDFNPRDIPRFWPRRRGRKCGRKTHCVNGHEFTPQNTIIYRRDGQKPIHQCRTCTYERNARYRHDNREKLNHKHNLRRRKKRHLALDKRWHD